MVFTPAIAFGDWPRSPAFFSDNRDLSKLPRAEVETIQRQVRLRYDVIATGLLTLAVFYVLVSLPRLVRGQPNAEQAVPYPQAAASARPSVSD